MKSKQSPGRADPDGDVDPDVLDLARALAKVLRRGSPDSAPAVYTCDDLPPGCPSRRRFADRCKRIPEARRDGRCWVVPRDAYERASRAGPQPPPSTPRPRVDDSAEALLASAGIQLRAPRKG